MATTQQWLAATRPRTLPAAIAPVIVGWAVAYDVATGDVPVDAVNGMLALVVALALQIGVNFSNDYSDGIRGTDAVRVGPVRLVGQQLAAPAQVKAAAFAAFGGAALAGFVIVLRTGAWPLLAVGALAILSAWFYTGGSNPYGYAGFGEVFVFVWFGLVAVQGTVFVMADRMPWSGWLYGIGAGALSCALLVANNLRDVPTDETVGKRTLAVRIGVQNTRWLYVGLVWVALAVPFAAMWWERAQPKWWLLLTLVAAISAHRPGWAVIRGATGRELLPVLAATGRTQLLWAVSVAVAYALSAR